MKSIRFKRVTFALGAALIWGLAFAFQRSAAGTIGPFSFNLYRCVLAVVSLGAVLLIRRGRGKTLVPPEKKKQLVLGGLVTGALLFAASNLQQAGLSGTEAGKAGFLTAMYSVLVPVLGVLFFKKRVTPLLWLSVGLMAAGLYLICIKQGFALASSDLLVIACAAVYALYILAVDHFVEGIDPMALSFTHFLVSGVLCALAAFTLEQPNWASIRQCAVSLLYVGVLSSAVAYSLEFAAHQLGNPVAVSLLLCMESVFSVLGGAVILSERLTARELIGCAVMLCAVILAQLPEPDPGKREKAPSA